MHKIPTYFAQALARKPTVKRNKLAVKSKQVAHGGDDQMSFVVQKFVCAKCGKEYKERRLLNRHMRVHTGQFPFYCEQCNKGFNDRSRYNMHTERYHV